MKGRQHLFDELSDEEIENDDEGSKIIDVEEYEIK
jgi:hypothetical protein